jgi:stearoyl-CoA desaturase (Delta-9 desaturase)
MPAEISLATPAPTRRDHGEPRLPHPLRLVLPWGRRVLRLNHVTLLLRLSLAIELAAFIAGLCWFALEGIGWFEVAIFFAMFLVSGLGITVGYHRLFSHRAMRARAWVRLMLGIMGAMGMQGPILYWVSIHRKHHRYSDEPEDPHSPLPIGSGRFAALRGAWHGFAGWIVDGSFCLYPDYIKDLRRDSVVLFVDRWYPLWVAAGIALPGLAGWAWYGTLHGFIACAFAGGPVRLFFTLTAAWYVNSAAHLFGSRPYATADDSRNNLFVNVMSLIGEGYHNNHHAFPRSAKFALQPGQVDIGYWLVRLLELTGQVDKVIVPSASAVPVAPEAEYQ